MLLCSKCGASLRPSAKLCIRCGTAVSAALSDPAAGSGGKSLLEPGAIEVSLALQADTGSRNEAAQPGLDAGSALSIVKDLTASGLSTGVARVQEAALHPVKTAVFSTGAKFLIMGVLTVGIGAAAIFGFVQWRSNSSGEVATTSNSVEARREADASHGTTPPGLKPSVPEPEDTASSRSNVEERPDATRQAVAELPPKSIEATTLPASRSSTLDPKLAALMHAAEFADWNQVREQSQAIKQSASAPHGNRREARAANAEGLKALNSGDYAMAVSRLQEGVKADPGDVEARNNLGYAQLKAGNHGDAISTLTQLLLFVPDRTSAWANLSETFAGAGDLAAARSCLRLAVYFSSNRDRTVTFLSQVAYSHPSQQFRGVVSEVLQSISSIPNDAAPKPEKKTAVARVASPPVTAAAGTGNQPAPATNNEAIAELVRQARNAMDAKRYQEAIAVGRSVLAIDSSNQAARQLVQQASEAQRRDLESVEIK